MTGALALAKGGEQPREVFAALVGACAVPKPLARAVSERVMGRHVGKAIATGEESAELIKLCPKLADVPTSCGFRLGSEETQACRTAVVDACLLSESKLLSEAEANVLPAHTLLTLELLGRWLEGRGAAPADARALSRVVGRDLLACAADKMSPACHAGLARRGAGFGLAASTARGLELIVARGHSVAHPDAVRVVVSPNGITYGPVHAVPIDCTTIAGGPCPIGEQLDSGSVRWTIPESHMNATDPLRLDDVVRAARRLAGNEPAPPALVVLDARLPSQLLKRVVHSLVESRHHRVALGVADPRDWNRATLRTVPLAIGPAPGGVVVVTITPAMVTLAGPDGPLGPPISLSRDAGKDTAAQVATAAAAIPAGLRVVLRVDDDVASHVIVALAAVLSVDSDGRARPVAIELGKAVSPTK